MTKNSTYMLTVSYLLHTTPVFTLLDADGKTNMSTTINQKKGEPLVSPTVANGKTPEERPLDVSTMKTSLVIAAKEMENAAPYANNKNLATSHLEFLKNPKVQQLIADYSNECTIDGKHNPNKIPGTIRESWIIGLMITGDTDFLIQEDKEMKDRQGWLKTKVSSALSQVLSTQGATTITPAIVKNLFPKITDDKAKSVVELIGFWDNVLEKSPANSFSSSCP
jgi:hypothetical protein